METKFITIHVPVAEPEPRVAPRNRHTSFSGQLETAFSKAIDIVSYVVVGVSAGAIVGAWAIPKAAAERGYSGAIGGEWLLIPAVIFCACWIHSKALRWGSRK